MDFEEQYQRICKDRFDRLERLLEESVKETKLLNQKLFVGNGKDPWDTRLDRLERFTANVKWVLGTITASVIGVVTWIVKGAFTK